MPTEAVFIFNTLFGIILLLVTAIVKVLWDAVKTLQKDMNRLEVALPTSYVNRAEYHADMKEITAMLEKIADKLDAKADKSK
jgi:hypothetical protein